MLVCHYCWHLIGPAEPIEWDFEEQPYHGYCAVKLKEKFGL